MERAYTIYRLTSPSGKSYIGLTKTPLKERWRHHVRRAFKESRNHPLYNAIRKYGPESFIVENIDSAPNKAEAQALERLYIAWTSPEYNLSPGGEADGEAGSRIFWNRINADPEAREEYLKLLSEVKKKQDWSDYSTMSEKAQEWRKNNPREAYRLAYRAIRIARRSKPIKQKETRSLKDRLMWKHKRSVKTRENTFALWARRTDAERIEVAAKISKKVKERWETVTDPQERSRLTAQARAAIDRKKQRPAASRGIKRFWEELRKDPARYAEYMAARNASLKKTNERKKRDANL